MATPHFWLLFLVYLLTGLGSFFVSLHQLAFATDMGFEPLHAAGILGMGSFLSVAGTIFTGSISDYIGREVAAIIAYGISIVGVIAALFITNADQTWLLWVHAGFFGLTWGARGPDDHRQDRRPLPGPPPGRDPGRHLHRHRHRRRRRAPGPAG